MGHEALKEIVEYYRAQGAPQDQQMLIALLREVQEESDGLLTISVLDDVAQAFGMKTTLLQALVKRIPDLRCEDVPHRLEVCGTCRAGAKLRDYIETTYGVKSGGSSEIAGFSYRVTSCMKNCKNGPSIRWDGKLHSRADEELVRKLIGKKN